MRRILLALTLFLAITPVSRAETDAERVNRIVFGPARYNPLDSATETYRDTLRIELRLPTIAVWKFHPWLGVEMLQKNGLWAGAGLETDINLSDRIILTIQTGAGYLDDGNEHEHYNVYPKSGFEFRSQAELSYEIIDDGARIGIGISHISNANLRKTNPGIESLGINMHVPIELFN